MAKTATAKRPGLHSVPRREVILSSAARLFGERGFRAVSIDEIGAASGITGPGIYRHFSNKEAVLVTLLDDVSARLLGGARQILKREGRTRAALEQMVRFHAEFAYDERALVAIYVREEMHLCDEDRQRLRRRQRTYVDDWVKVLAAILPGLAPERARARVYAGFGLLHANVDAFVRVDRACLVDLLSSMALAALLVA